MYINLNNQFKIIYKFYLKYYDSEKVEKSIRERKVNKEDLIEDNRRKTNLMFLSLYKEFEKNQGKIRDLVLNQKIYVHLHKKYLNLQVYPFS